VPPTVTTARTINNCAGPGGWEEGARILGGQTLLDELGILGIEINRDAAATARAAGHARKVTDARKINPRYARKATGAIFSWPCPTFSPGGKHSGIDDLQLILDTVTHFGEDPDCNCDYRDIYERVQDPRSALMVETARWVFRAPKLEWIVCEQAPTLEYFWEDFAAELFAAGWEDANVAVFESADLGTSARRRRSFMWARRYKPSGPSFFDGHPTMPQTSMAKALGYAPGEEIRTRGNRKTSGGNLFSADGLSWCLTGSSRSWTRESDGQKIPAADGGYLNGFPHDYPWSGSPSAQWMQVADVVAPPAAAVVLGAALGIDWRGPVAAWAAERASAMSPAAIERAQADGFIFHLERAS
jgi:DNA (cytosine-5)-methyltransferase 1